jgi:catechol 2,3-dioxygenase-like lactoylglutathione lyase family enzyme
MGSKTGDLVHFEINASAAKAPTIYFGTDDIDATLKKIKDAGGKADEKAPIPGQGWFAACVDPDGNSFSLYQDDPSVTVEQMAEYQATHA